MKPFLRTVSFILLLYACHENSPGTVDDGESVDAGDRGSADGGESDDARNEEFAARACEDMAVRIAEASARCGEMDRETAYRSYLKQAVRGDCHSVVAVRDSTRLYDDCLPALETINCSDFLAYRLPSACKDQLVIKLIEE